MPVELILFKSNEWNEKKNANEAGSAVDGATYPVW